MEASPHHAPADTGLPLRADHRAVRGDTTATRTFAELLIDCDWDRTLRAVLIGMLGEAMRPDELGADYERASTR
jgi:hypothetical protein